MTWRDLLQTKEEKVTVPWFGGRELRAIDRTFRLEGRLPPEKGWHTFDVERSRYATWRGTAQPAWNLSDRYPTVRGFLVGNALIEDGTKKRLYIHLVEPGLDRFARVRAIHYENQAFVYDGEEFPIGPEDEVREAFLDKRKKLDHIKGVTPALEEAFLLENLARCQAEEDRRKVEEERRRAELLAKIGTSEGRRELAQEDFESAAKAALRIGDAELLDWRPGRNEGTYVVDFRFEHEPFQCVCDQQLRIVDSGICLTDDYTGEKGDTYFTLESLPAVIGQALREGLLYRYRHVGR